MRTRQQKSRCKPPIQPQSTQRDTASMPPTRTGPEIDVEVGTAERNEIRRIVPGSGRTCWFKDFEHGPEMVVVPAGEFLMGQSKQEFRLQCLTGYTPRQRKVTIAEPFAVGRFAVTFDEWDAALATGGVMYRPSDKHWGRGKRPVICVSWDDAQTYVAWLSKATGKPYRLLFEAEWEYAARADTTTPYWWGALASSEQANFDGRSGRQTPTSTRRYRGRTAPVNTFESNPWGLYQVHGNVWELCDDVWHIDESDGFVSHVVRGGSWINGSNNIVASKRSCSLGPNYRYSHHGFRVARTLSG